MDKDFMLHYFNKAVQPEWEELLKTPRYQPAASKRDAIAREFFRMLNDEQKRKLCSVYGAVFRFVCRFRGTATILNKNRIVLPRKVGRKEKDFVLYCVKNHCKGGNIMNHARKLYLDNIRWMTVVLVVIYHVVYLFNGEQPFGVIGPFRERQLQDCFQYLVYPWFMALLFVVSGMSARYYLQSHTTKQFLKDKTC